MVGKQQQSEKFQQVYQQLNPQQKLAVDTIEGPVMVIAGPGTGKTQILSARIGKILTDTDARPENILCLTYTDAGVVAMRRRLLNFIGADAYKVNIYTFHAFCNDVIQDNLSMFEKTALDPISDLERIELLKQLIDTFPKNHPLKRYRGDVYFEITNLQSLFSTMKREGWTPAFINSKIDEYIASLPFRDEYIAKRAVKEFKKGDVRTDKIADEQEKMEKLRAAVNEFDHFQQAMRQRNRYDFDDMINWVIRAFEENKGMLNRYQEQFLYILVDEYQDTSGTQNKLVELLINFWEKPNVFVVGDDDQSIYRFQGANIENMLTFADSYKDTLLTVILTNNYRSTQPILDVSKSVIGRNQERLVTQISGLSKELISANKRISHMIHRPQIKEYMTQRQEMIDITLQIEQLLNEGVGPGRMAVIYKENRYGETLAEYFRARNIPMYSKRSLNVLHIPLVQKILLLLRYLSAELDVPYGGDEMLFEVLHFDWFHIPAIEVAKVSVEAADRKYGENKTTLRQLLVEKSNQPARDLFSVNIHPKLKDASQIIEKLVSEVPNITLQNLFESIIRGAGVLGIIMKSPDKIMMMQVLTTLFDFVKEETRRNPILNVHGFINIIDLMEKEGISLPMTQVSGNEKGINLLTAHGSKGLEFEYVFLAGCNAASWEKKRKPGGGYSMPDTLFSSAASAAHENNEELRRLFYVALTRAEQHLCISYSRFKSDGKELEPSMFIAEIQEEHSLPVEKVTVDTETEFGFQGLAFHALQAPEIEQVEADWITRMLDKFSMNVTALNNYLKCPLEFYFKNLVRIPSPKNEATEFGSAVHYALERLFEKMKTNNEQFSPVADFITDFERYMHRHRESFTREQFLRRLEYGQDVLSNYYEKYINEWNKIVSIERNIKNVIVNGVPLKGKLDKLEFFGKEANVVDYKTGDPDKAREKLLPPNERNPNGGDYWRQAVFYKILVDQYERKSWKVVSTEFDFVEPDKKKEYQKRKVVIAPEDITTVNQQISLVWDKIQARDFYTGCGKEDCHWCQFVKTNNMAVKLHEIAEEEEV
ncbi:DNA helicase-2 / ATP-dependent DNA helicase PcrA [Filimonas lacunae]|uniref:DNA 3'-5' helicase n=1 Tax=Filimonas lacunae TaxID=477680 RepID=A0A173MQP0_9BACT|nr:ATP-dependent DNA helicase [Filimonas lacunae]BAV09983.1 ATP-dependent DNA helicase UvrD/PcrA [Filimonas lacunae]SIS82071.1 DNA helicase-2 / ATP-dependent DNA helicase PcrA [Filimonas lacunae]